jgi:hypothetical protein
VEPYLVVVDKKSNRTKLVGYPLERIGTGKHGQLRHYYFDKLRLDDVQILPDTFSAIRVEPQHVFDTPNVVVKCRVQFVDVSGKDLYEDFTRNYD